MFESLKAAVDQLFPFFVFAVGVCIGIGSYQIGKNRKDRKKNAEKKEKLYHSKPLKGLKRPEVLEPGTARQAGAQANMQSGSRVSPRTEAQTGGKGKKPLTAVTRQQCWEAYKEAFYEKEVSKRLRDVYSRDSLLYSFRKLLGIARYDLEAYGWESGRDRIENVINQEIPSALRRYIGNPKGGKAPKLPGRESVLTDITEEEYYRQQGFLEKKGEALSAQALEEELAQLRKEKAESINGRQGAFYRKLWENSVPLLEEMMAYGAKLKSALDEAADAPSQKDMEKQFLAFADRLKEAMEKNGIRFLFAHEASEKEKGEYFKMVKQGENVPAVIRRDDQYVYYTGQAEIR